MKRLFVLILATLMLLSFVGCTPAAGGRHPELFVVASHSLLGALGRDREDTIILEEDEFGRVMFAYVGNTVTSDRPGAMFNILAVAIAQRTTRRYSYFYDGVNIIFQEIEVDCGPSPLPFLSKEFVMEHFTEGQLEQLKVENSWNEELNEDRFFRVRVARGTKTRHMTTVSRETLDEIFQVASDGFDARFRVPLTMDRDGNVIYFIRDGTLRGREWDFYSAFLFMFDRRGNLIEGTGVMGLYDLWDYRDQLREFKEANGWNFYWR
ncbi:MAG: hypothetical protein FWC72_05170 [Oscillospiraceae bacterium]|nr:hypothetical protein [Oscillospiraceae bacterium]